MMNGKSHDDQILGLFTPPVRRAKKKTGLGAQEVPRYQVTTHDPSPAGDLDVRSAPDASDGLQGVGNGNVIGRAVKDSVVTWAGDSVTGPLTGGRTAVFQNITTQDGVTGWVPATYLVAFATPPGPPRPLPGNEPVPPAPTPTPTPTPPSTTSYTGWILGGAAVVGGGVIVYALFVRPRAKHMRAAATAHEEEGKRRLAYAKRLREEAAHAAAREGAAKRRAKRLRA